MAKNDFKKSYERKRGNQGARNTSEISITFSWTKLDITQGQSIEKWEQDGLLSKLCIRLQQIGQYHSSEALAKQLIKQYTKIEYQLPENSEFNEPKHILNLPKHWAVIHIKENSKEVVAGYLEDDIFYIVFLDKEHVFWPTDIQRRGKVRR